MDAPLGAMSAGKALLSGWWIAGVMPRALPRSAPSPVVRFASRDALFGSSRVALLNGNYQCRPSRAGPCDEHLISTDEDAPVPMMRHRPATRYSNV
jgi:hypothetical protein